MKTIMILCILLFYTLGSVSGQPKKPNGPFVGPCKKHSDCGGQRPFCAYPPGAPREGASLLCRPCPMNKKQCKNGWDGKCGPKCGKPKPKNDEKALNAPKGSAKKKDEEKGDDDSCRRHLDCPRTKPFCAKKKGKGGDKKKDGPKGDNDKAKPRPYGVCKRCNDCKRCGDGIDGTCGKKCPLIFPRKTFPLEGAKVCQRDPPKVNCEVCYNGSYMIGCTEFVCIADEENEGEYVGVKRFDYEDEECGEKDGIANYCIDWAERP